MRGITVWLDENKVYNKMVKFGFSRTDVDKNINRSNGFLSKMFTKYNGECKIRNAEAIADVLSCDLEEILLDEKKPSNDPQDSLEGYSEGVSQAVWRIEPVVTVKYICGNCFHGASTASKFCPNCGTELNGITNGDTFNIIKMEDATCEE